MATLGERLRETRRRALLTQEELSDASGVPVVTISRIENDQPSEPRPSTIRKLAGALNVDPAWLLFGDEGKAAA